MNKLEPRSKKEFFDLFINKNKEPWDFELSGTLYLEIIIDLSDKLDNNTISFKEIILLVYLHIKYNLKISKPLLKCIEYYYQKDKDIYFIFLMGEIFKNGILPYKKDDEKAITCLKIAIDNGITYAISDYLDLLFINKKFDDLDYVKKLIEKDINSPISMRIKGYLILNNYYDNLNNNDGIALLEKAFNLEDYCSAYYLALYYDSIMDYKKSNEYLLVGCNKKIKECYPILAKHFEMGLGVIKDANIAINYYLKSGDFNSINTAYKLSNYDESIKVKLYKFNNDTVRLYKIVDLLKSESKDDNKLGLSYLSNDLEIYKDSLIKMYLYFLGLNKKLIAVRILGLALDAKDIKAIEYAKNYKIYKSKVDKLIKEYKLNKM